MVAAMQGRTVGRVQTLTGIGFSRAAEPDEAGRAENGVACLPRL